MSALSFHRLLEIGGPWVNEGIRAFLSQSRWQPEIRQLCDDYLHGGKKVRPLLSLFIYSQMKGSSQKPALEILQALASLEFIHAYSLIHDDLPCMDNDDFRRGLPTMHRLVGDGPALLVGDALLTGAFENISILKCHDSIKVALLKILSSAAGASSMVGGQWVDVVGVQKNLLKSMSADQILDLHAKKTGALIGASLVFGRVLSQEHSSQDVQKTYDELFLAGVKLGTLFQIVDDLLESAEQSAGELSVLHVFSRQEISGLMDKIQGEVNTLLSPYLTLSSRQELLSYFINRKH